MIPLREEYQIAGTEGEGLRISHAVILYLEFDGLQERITRLISDLILGRRWRADRDLPDENYPVSLRALFQGFLHG
jgi:hypothetical protein